jgi:hypothetical protein
VEHNAAPDSKKFGILYFAKSFIDSVLKSIAGPDLLHLAIFRIHKSRLAKLQRLKGNLPATLFLVSRGARAFYILQVVENTTITI